MTIKQRVEYQRSVLMYKCLSGLAPNYLSVLFQYSAPNHQYSLRSNNIIQLIVPKAKTEQFKLSFSYAGAIHNKVCFFIRHFKFFAKKHF